MAKTFKNPLLQYIVSQEKLPSQSVSRLLPLGFFAIGITLLLMAATQSRNMIESYSVLLGFVVCPSAFILPVILAVLAGETYSIYIDKLDSDQELQNAITSDTQIVHGLWRGTFERFGPMAGLFIVAMVLMATSLALQVDFGDTWTGSYGPPAPPLSSYTTADYVSNAVFWYIFHIGLLGLNVLAVMLSVWLCIRLRSELASIIAAGLVFILILAFTGAALKIAFWGNKVEASTFDFTLGTLGGCIAPTIILSALAYLASLRSSRRNRFS